jgi:transposase
MNFIGVDLHKKSITVCVMDQNRKVLARKTLACTQTKEIVEFFRQYRPFKVVLEATASYPWFVELVEPLAEKVVLANPKKLRVIAESTKKTDRLDAQILAEFLVLDMIPESYQPTPRQRQHRALVRHRQYLQGRITSVRSKIRHILGNYNADRKDLFSAQIGLAYFKEVSLSDADRFVIKQLWAEWQDHVAQRLALTKKLKAFVAKAAQREAEAREILKSAPGVGFVTAEVILSELGDISRFRNAKAVCAYAGLVPIVRQSGEKKSKNMRITKEGSGLLRWALVEAAWRLVRESPKWAARFSRLMQRSGKKRAIVAMARKLLCVLYAMLRTSTPYQIVTTETKAPRAPGKKVVRISRKEQTATLQTATAEQTAATRRARKQSTTATTAKQTTTKQTTASRTTRKKLLTRPTPEPTTTT